MAFTQKPCHGAGNAAGGILPALQLPDPLPAKGHVGAVDISTPILFRAGAATADMSTEKEAQADADYAGLAG
jgi:hypothetical protein